MSLISAIVAVCKSLPILERLFLQIADGIKEAKAKARYEAKLDHIDAAIAFHRMSDDPRVEWDEGTDGSPTVPGGSEGSAGVDKGGTKKTSRG